MEYLNTQDLLITSPAFGNEGFIPARYTCDGDNVSPSLAITGIPDGAKSLALIMDDPDAPGGTWDHWIVWDIPPNSKIAENSNPGTEGINSFRRHHYGGPCPPSGTHRYYFKVYALDTLLGLKNTSDKAAINKAMDGHILAQGEMIGFYKRQ